MEQQHLHEESVLNFFKIIFKHKIVLVIGIIISGVSSYFLQSESSVFLNKAVVEFEITNEDRKLTEKLCEISAKKFGFNIYLPRQTTESLNAELTRLGQDKKIFFDVSFPINFREVKDNCPIFEAEVKFKTKYSAANRELTEGLLEQISDILERYVETYVSDKIFAQVSLNEQSLMAHLRELSNMTSSRETYVTAHFDRTLEKQRNQIKKIIGMQKHELALFISQKPSHEGVYNQISLKPATEIKLISSPVAIFFVGVFFSFIVSLLLEVYLRQKKQLRPNQN